MVKRKKVKLTRYERGEAQKNKIKYYQAGRGLYVFRNNTNGTLNLPKTSSDGKKTVARNATFEGDDYFMSLVRNNECRLVSVIEAAKTDEELAVLNESHEPTLDLHEEQKMGEKLIVDQPDRVTTEGTIESVVVKKPLSVPLDESGETAEQTEDTLLLEDPAAGIVIVQ